MENSAEDLPEEILKEAENASLELLPAKSKSRYEKEFSVFNVWCDQRKVKCVREEVMLAYFSSISKTCKPSTLWSRYSMLKAVLKAKKNVDIGNFLKLSAYLKRQNVGYRPKKSKTFEKRDISRFFNEAPDDIYLHIKVATVFGLAGACRREELTYIKITDIQDKGDMLIVTIPDTKTHTSRVFVISNETEHGKECLKLYRKYLNLRPPNTPHQRLFVYYKMGKCTSQCIGINSFGKMPSEIAAFLKLPNPELYTGHSFRRTSVTILADSGANITSIKRHGGWKSTTVAEGYIEESIANKKETSNKILASDKVPSTSSAPTEEAISIDEKEIINNNILAINEIPSTTRAETNNDPLRNFLASAINLQNAKNCSFVVNINSK